MRILDMNKKMRELYCPDWDLRNTVLPDELSGMIESGVVFHQGCFVLRDPLKANPHIQVNECYDRTEYEATLNEVHMEGLTDRDELHIAFAFLQKISDVVRKEFPDETFYGIVSADLDGRDCVATFHCRHEGESTWLATDLEGYKENAVCLIDLSPDQCGPRNEQAKM